MIRVGRAIIAQLKQAERRITVLTEANLLAKLLQLFFYTVPNVLRLVGFRQNCLILRLGAVSSSKPQLYYSHLSLGLLMLKSEQHILFVFYFNSDLFDVVNFCSTQGENALIGKMEP